MFGAVVPRRVHAHAKISLNTRILHTRQPLLTTCVGTGIIAPQPKLGAVLTATPHILHGGFSLSKHSYSSYFSQGRKSTTVNERKPKSRIAWQDTTLSLPHRVKLFVDSERLRDVDYVIPETVDFIHDCCRMSDRLLGMKLAHDLLDRLTVEKRRLRQKGVVVTIPIDIINTIMNGWALTSGYFPGARERMDQLLKKAIHDALEDESAFYELERGNNLRAGQWQDYPLKSQLNVDTFNTFLKGLVFESKVNPSATAECDRIIEEMERCVKDYGWKTRPNSRSYTYVIHAIKNSGRHSAGSEAEKILRQMKEIHQIESKKYYERFGVRYNAAEPSSNAYRIITPDIAAYTLVIEACSLHESGQEKAIELLNELLLTKGQVPDEQVYVTVINAFSETALKGKTPPQRVQAAERAEKIFWTILDVFGKAGEKNNESLTIALNACLRCWSRTYAEETAPRCEELLHKVLVDDRISPDFISFNTCLHAWSRSSNFHPDSAKKAENLLDLQHQLAAPDALGARVKPDFHSYTAVLFAYRSSEYPDRVVHARRLLDRLLGLIADGKIAKDKNATAPFAAVISAAARSPSCASTRSDPDGFVGAINVNEENAYSIAKRTFQELDDDTHKLGLKPDHHVYSAFVRCISKHTTVESTEREMMVRMILEKACEGGQVSELLVDALTFTMRDRLALLPEFQADELPKYWTRNVPHREQYYKRPGVPIYLAKKD